MNREELEGVISCLNESDTYIPFIQTFIEYARKGWEMENEGKIVVKLDTLKHREVDWTRIQNVFETGEET